MISNKTFSADGNSATIAWPGGYGSMLASGTWGSGTLKLQFTINGGTTWVDVASISLTANGHKEFNIGSCHLRMNLAGATNPAIAARVASFDGSRG